MSGLSERPSTYVPIIGYLKPPCTVLLIPGPSYLKEIVTNERKDRCNHAASLLDERIDERSEVCSGKLEAMEH